MRLNKIFFFVISLLVLSSCEKDIGTLGLGMLPDDDILTLKADTVKGFNCSYHVDDTVRTTDYELLLGSYQDPVFGLVQADIYAPIYFDSPVIDKSGTYEITSVKLLLIDSSFQYGKKVPQDIDVYEIMELIDTTYYEDLSFSPKEEFMATLTLDTTFSEDEDDTLKYTFGEEFTTRIKDFISSDAYSIDTDSYYVNEKFVEIFKGLHFAPKGSDAFIEKLMDIQIVVKANVCTSDGDCEEVDQYLYVTNYIDRDSLLYFHPLISFKLEHPQTMVDKQDQEYQSTTYIQPMKGYKTRIRMDEMDRWRDSQNVVINAAKLFIPIEVDDDYPAYEQIELAIDDEEDYAAISSAELQGESQYTIYITSFFKDFVAGSTSASDHKFELRVPESNLYVNRSVLKADETYLQIIYTKYQ